MKTIMLTRNPKLDESYFISSFISGLKEKIKPMVKMFKLQTLAKTFEVAKLQESYLDIQSKQSKPSGRIAVEPKFGMYRNSVSGQNHQNSTSYLQLLQSLRRLTPHVENSVRFQLRKCSISVNITCVIHVEKGLE